MNTICVFPFASLFFFRIFLSIRISYNKTKLAMFYWKLISHVWQLHMTAIFWECYFSPVLRARKGETVTSLYCVNVYLWMNCLFLCLLTVIFVFLYIIFALSMTEKQIYLLEQNWLEHNWFYPPVIVIGMLRNIIWYTLFVWKWQF